jgi:hypothetical protein
MLKNEVVVCGGPRAVDHDRPDGNIVLPAPVDQVLNSGDGIDVVLPHPQLQRPWRRDRRMTGVALRHGDGEKQQQAERRQKRHEQSDFLHRKSIRR